MKFENLQLLVNDLPKAEELHYERLNPDYKNVRLISTILVFVLMHIAGLIVLAFSGLLTWLPGWGVVLTFALCYFMLSVLIIYKGFPRKGYAIREHDIAYKSGYLFHSRTIMPFTRIQHCEISQGPMEKMFDLCSLNIFTAGGSGSDLVIPGLHFEDGEKLRAFILERAEVYGKK